MTNYIATLNGIMSMFDMGEIESGPYKGKTQAEKRMIKFSIFI